MIEGGQTHGLGNLFWTADQSRTLHTRVNQQFVFHETILGRDYTHTLTAEGHDASEDGTGREMPLITDGGMRIRRLTPTEGERLQGFPDGWGIPEGPSLAETPAWYEMPPGERRMTYDPDVDGSYTAQRWEAMGRAVTVPITEWIGRRLTAHAGDWANRPTGVVAFRPVPEMKE